MNLTAEYSALYMLLYLVCGLVLFMPMLRLLNAWLFDRTLSPPLALGAIAGFTMIMASLWQARDLRLLLGVTLLFALLSALTPLLTALTERAEIRRMHLEDVERLERLVARRSDNAIAQAALGHAYLAQKRYADSVAAFEKAFEVDSHLGTTEQSALAKARAGLEALTAKSPKRRGLLAPGAPKRSDADVAPPKG
jgi:hypothetical protein